MSKQKILVSSIGTRVLTPEEKARRRYERSILLRLGVLPSYFTDKGSNKIAEKKMSSRADGRFSTNYATYEEYIHDANAIIDIVFSGGYAPEELVSKVEHTVKELNLQDL